MELQHLLDYVAQELGLSSLDLNESGVASLQIGEHLILNIEPDPDGSHCHLYSSLCRLPSDDESRLRLYDALLRANNFGKGTAGATFSVDHQHGEILLGRVFNPAQTEPTDVMSWLQDMVEVMEIWQQRVLDLGADEGDEADGPDGDEADANPDETGPAPTAEDIHMNFIRA